MSSNGLVEAATPQEQLQARLADPRTVDSLNRMLDHLDTISASVEMLEGFLRRGDEIADNVADSVQELRGVDASGATQFVEKLPSLAKAGTKMADVANSPAVDRLLQSGLLERLSEPNTITALTTVLDKIDLLAFAATSVDGFLRRGDEIADNAADSMNDVKTLVSSFEIDLEQLKGIAAAMPKLTAAGNEIISSGLLDQVSTLSNAGMTLANAGFFEPRTVSLLAEMGQAAADSYDKARTAPQQHYGIFDLMKLLKDPAIQKTLNIVVEASRQFGKKLS